MCKHEAGEDKPKPVAVSPPAAASATMTGPSLAFTAVRLDGNPIITPGMAGLEGEDGANINGPSLIAVPTWAGKPLGKYYLYFAHHGGKYIRLAYAETLSGPWTIHAGGVMTVEEGPGGGHIASPDVHVDLAAKQIRMYFHMGSAKDKPELGQVSFVATSGDGLKFQPRDEVLGTFYFRVFRYGGYHYALAKNGDVDGIMYRSKDGLTNFEPGPRFLPGVRHTAVWVEGDWAYVVYSLVGEAPERLYITRMDLRGDWLQWTVPHGQMLLEPCEEWEGVKLPLRKSSYGAAEGPLRELRDPAVFFESGRQYLLYSVAAEQGIAIAECHWPGK